ncbi:MAG: hypothetical protein ABIG88_03000 [Patescibacteria group bacterium]
MENNEIIRKVVKFTESIVNGNDFNETEIQKILNLSYHSDSNLNIYRGILCVHNFHKFKKLPLEQFRNLSADERFIKCVFLLNGDTLLSSEIGNLFLNILTIPDEEIEYRDILLGSFFGSLWLLMNNHENFKIAVDYGVEIIKSAFSIDRFNFSKKIKLERNDAKIINLAGSGKKEIKLLNISSMVAVIIATVGKKINENIIVEKTISQSTSSITGSGDIFESVGVNLDIPINKIAEMSLETKLGVFDINKIVPKLNRIYDGRLYDIQVFAGLVGGAAIVNPIDTDLINYGLTRGSSKLCLAILNELYSDKNIIVIQGKNPRGQAVIDQISIVADTEIAQRINGKSSLYTITPKEFSFDFEPFKYVQTTKSQKENINQFIKLLAGQGNKNLKQAVAMEVALNLYGLGVINNLKNAALLSLEVINSGEGVNLLKNLVIASGGDVNKFDKLIKNII